MNRILNNSETFTIVVTDSGLGGLSVLAELEKEFRVRNRFGRIKLVFFNSLAASDFGYNSMPDMKAKAEVFDSALDSMMKLYNPDLILIACNTLSVVYEETCFSKTNTTEVLGIIDFGLQMILEATLKNKNSSVLLLGTPTTINSNEYKNRLLNNGMEDEFIINQACPLLETEIQRNPESETVHKMINEFLNEAKSKESKKSKNVIAALCCTHYGYSEKIFDKYLREVFTQGYTVINPNRKMAQFVIDKLSSRDNKTSEISVEVVSQVKLKKTEIESISKILKKISPLTASALNNYILNNSLFHYKKLN